jgi:hypothetical protein
MLGIHHFVILVGHASMYIIRVKEEETRPCNIPKSMPARTWFWMEEEQLLSAHYTDNHIS